MSSSDFPNSLPSTNYTKYVESSTIIESSLIPKCTEPDQMEEQKTRSNPQATSEQIENKYQSSSNVSSAISLEDEKVKKVTKEKEQLVDQNEQLVKKNEQLTIEKEQMAIEKEESDKKLEELAKKKEESEKKLEELALEFLRYKMIVEQQNKNDQKTLSNQNTDHDDQRKNQDQQ